MYSYNINQGEQQMNKQIAYRFNSAKSPAWYVSEVKGNGGKDWGYSTDVEKAVKLNTNQWKSFAKDMRECGTVAFSISG